MTEETHRGWIVIMCVVILLLVWGGLDLAYRMGRMACEMGLPS